MVIETARRVDQVHSNGRNGHSIPPTVSLGAEAGLTELSPGVNVPEAFAITTELQKRIFAHNPAINEEVEELDGFSERWMRAKLLGSNDTAFAWGIEAGTTGKMIEGIIKGVRFQDLIKDEIGEMYRKLCEEVGEEDVIVAVGIGDEISLRKGENGVLDAIKKRLAAQFGAGAVRRRNEARLKMAHDLLESGSADIDSAIAESKSLSHQESNLPIVFQRWRMRSSQK